MDPAFAASEHTYTVWVPDNQTGTYAWATLSEAAPEGSEITAKWNHTSGAAKTAAITSGSSYGQFLSGLLSAGETGGDVTLGGGGRGGPPVLPASYSAHAHPV